MTGSVPPGTLLVSPADVARLVPLVREGARVLAAHRPLPAATADLIMAVELAAYEARCAAATAAGPGAAAAAPSAAQVDVREAARMLGVSAQYVRRQLAGGELIGRKVGSSWAVDADSLAAAVLARQGVA